jgi:hypothetical protein
VTNEGNYRVQEFNSSGAFLSQLGGTYGNANGQFAGVSPNNVAGQPARRASGSRLRPVESEAAFRYTGSLERLRETTCR